MCGGKDGTGGSRVIPLRLLRPLDHLIITLSHLNSIMNSSWHLMLHVLSNGFLLGIAYFVRTVVTELVSIGQRKRDSLVSGKCQSRRKKKGSHEELQGVEDGHQIHGEIMGSRSAHLFQSLDRTIPSLIYQLTKALCHPLCPLTAPLDDWSWMTRSRFTVDDTSSPWSAAYYCCTPPPTTPQWSGSHRCRVTGFQS